jgi:ketosteroid isomerase-like protein
MDNHVRSLEGLARQVRIAYESGDVASFAELLDPNVRWGPPGDPAPPCQNREQVLAWYERGSQAGMTARVSEVSVLGDRILVGLMVADSKASKQRGGAAARWQLLTVREGRVVDIVGFEQKSEALDWAESPAR